MEEAMEAGGHILRKSLVVALLLGLTVAALAAGLQLRRAAWFFADGAHFRGDMSNAYYWGHEADAGGLFHLYDNVAAGAISGPDRKVDYPPLRLTVITAWWRWTHRNYPDATEVQDNYNFMRPLLAFNTLAELASGILVFLVVRLWRIRQDDARRIQGQEKKAFRGVGAGMLGAMIFWFNPAIIWIGHAWPQWDVWLIPFFIAAVLLASLDWWFAAGICLAVGASLKGQLLLGAPLLLLWPIFRLRFDAALKLLAGFVLGGAGIALPWMHPDAAAWRWGIGMIAAMGCVLPLVFRWNVRRWYIAAGLGAVGLLLAWPWQARGISIGLRLAPVGLVAILIVTRWLPLAWRPAMPALVGACAVLLMMPLFDASSAWFTYGFKYGTEKFQFMMTGSGAYNVPRMLVAYWRWPRTVNDPVALPLIGQVTFATTTQIAYGFFLVLCGIGAALHDRRREARFLASMTAPWLLFFMILTQMHGRYSIWAAGISALLAGVGLGMALLGVAVSVVSLIGILDNQLMFARRWSPDTLELFRRMDPSLGWAMVLAALIYLYFAVMPRTEGRG